MKLYLSGAILVVIFAAGAIGFYITKHNSVSAEAVSKEKAVNAGPIIKVAKTINSAAGRDFAVIGEVKPYQSVTLYPKISGFLKQINVDKGETVKEGQVMGMIESPETDEAYHAAVSDAANKKAIMDRDQELLKKQYISQEQADLSRTAWQMSENQVNSLKAQVGYETLRAPFSGTVTARFVDAGALLQSAANSQGGAQPLVTIAQLDKVRIYYYINQADATYLKVGYPIEIGFQEKPGVKIPAKVSRISGQLDPNTRMMLAETDLDNKKGEYLPGSYIQINLKSPNGVGFPLVPIEALVVKKNKYYVLKVNTADTTLHYQEIQIKENTGSNILIQDGLKEGDVVALNLGESVLEGAKVRLAKQQ